jgi:predicted DCC family thiol-disulfide oxidoreductase YuxK
MQAAHLLLYDGVCALCNRAVRFVAARDGAARYRYAPLQGATARAALARHGLSSGALDTFVVLADAGSAAERALTRSAAALHVLTELGGRWRALARLARLIPRPARELAYRTIARSRYRLFGKHERCPLPPPELRERFVAD